MIFKHMEPSILYMGNPVVLVTTEDDNHSANIGPISSSWATGRTFVIGLLCNSKTFQNLIIDEHHIDPYKWKPLIYNFRHYFGLGKEFGKTFKAEV